MAVVVITTLLLLVSLGVCYAEVNSSLRGWLDEIGFCGILLKALLDAHWHSVVRRRRLGGNVLTIQVAPSSTVIADAEERSVDVADADVRTVMGMI